jgi:hypothetical protein
MEKMSIVLERFMEPYAEECDGIEALRRLYTLGVAAWNAALVPEDERSKTIDELCEKGLGRLTADDRQIGRAIIEGLVGRKIAHFSRYFRPIVAFDLRDMGDSYYLSVASAPLAP